MIINGIMMIEPNISVKAVIVMLSTGGQRRVNIDDIE